MEDLHFNHPLEKNTQIYVHLVANMLSYLYIYIYMHVIQKQIIYAY